MNQVELLEARLAILARQVTALSQQVQSPASLPEWFRRLAVEVNEVEQAAMAAGVNPERAWCACAERRLIIKELRRRKWSYGKIARTLHMSTNCVAKASKAGGGA